jgi:hypothetical protein
LTPTWGTKDERHRNPWPCSEFEVYVNIARTNTAPVRLSRAALAWLAALALGASLLAAAATAAPAGAVPANFWGAVPQNSLTAQQLQKLRSGGVDSLRVIIDWTAIQPTPTSKIDFGGTDAQVAEFAKAGIEVLPFLYGAPTWAVNQANVPGTSGTKAPAHLPVTGPAASGWRTFVRAAVERYGPQGTFWAENPEVPRRPIRTWQIWNEPNFKYFVARPNPVEYGKLVKLSSSAIAGADPGAKVLLAGLFARPKEAAFKKPPRQAYSAVEFLDLMYKGNPGIKTKFDGVSLHPYVTEYQRLPSEIEEVRDELRERGDGGKGLWITELGWSSESKRPSDSFAVGVQGQATQLRGAFTLLRNNAAKWRLKQVFWFSVDDRPGVCNFCGGSGLFAKGFKPKPAWNQYVRFAR